MLTSLAANGLSPATVPHHLLRGVLDQLVMTGRAVPAAKFVSSTEAAVRRRSILDIAGGAARPA